MNKTKRNSVLMIFSILVCMFYFLQETADARRFGGSRSFGSKPTYQRSAPAPAKKVAPTKTTNDQTIGQKPQTGVSPSPFGRFGGMMGGMLMGGLIGSLLFGGGGGVGGSGGGPGLLDILVIGGGLYFLVRFLRARRAATASPATAGSMPFETRPAQGWENMGYPATDSPGESISPAYPPDFNEEEFLKGANSLYTRLQASWDKRDLDDIRQFTSSEVYSEIVAQAEEEPEPGRTELLLINPDIVEVRETDGQTIATVLFDVMMREDGDELAKQVRELWHFSRDKGIPESCWMLEGIQQVE